MIPYPRFSFIIALILAIPTYGASLLIYYFLFKKPYDSIATSSILANAKNCLKSGTEGELFHVNTGAIRRVYMKFSDTSNALKYGLGANNTYWGVIIHPMINQCKPFTLKISKESGGRIIIEAADGEDVRLLKTD